MRTLPHVPTFQKAYKSYRVRFLGESRNAKSTVRAKFRCMAIAQYSIKKITLMGCPHFSQKQRCVCVCVCE